MGCVSRCSGKRERERLATELDSERQTSEGLRRQIEILADYITKLEGEKLAAVKALFGDSMRMAED